MIVGNRLFTAVVGKSLAAYIRDRRILFACRQLGTTDNTVLEIALNCGFHSAQAFSRTFSDLQGISPSEYRKQGYQPDIISADELVMRFTNRLRGGILLNPILLNVIGSSLPSPQVPAMRSRSRLIIFGLN